MRRRDLLAAGAAAGVAAMGGIANPAAAQSAGIVKPKGQAVLKLSSQDGVIPGKNLSEKLDNMEKWGFLGLEVGGKGLATRTKELQDALKGRPIKISAICAGFDGCLISTDKAQRDLAMTTMKEILTAAGELGSTGMIIVPAFHREDMIPHMEARKLLTGFARWDKKDRQREVALLQELGDHAAKCGTRVLLEPLNREECYFLRTLADAASICRDLENPGLAMMGDFWHMTWEETSDLGAFITAGDCLHHVHMASRRRRKLPTEDGDADNYVMGFKGLKLIGYQDYVSLECGAVGDRNVVIPAAVEMLRRQWEEA